MLRVYYVDCSYWNQLWKIIMQACRFEIAHSACRKGIEGLMGDHQVRFSLCFIKLRGLFEIDLYCCKLTMNMPMRLLRAFVASWLCFFSLNEYHVDLSTKERIPAFCPEGIHPTLMPD